MQIHIAWGISQKVRLNALFEDPPAFALCLQAVPIYLHAQVLLGALLFHNVELLLSTIQVARETEQLKKRDPSRQVSGMVPHLLRRLLNGSSQIASRN